MSSVTQAGLDDTPAAAADHTKSARAHEHVPPLDGIRGTAILLVLIGHFSESIVGEWGYVIPGIHAGLMGWVGVDLFFVLSGFLITGILFDAKESSSFFKTFYARRALRIFPLYYLAILVVFALSKIAPALHVYGTENPAWLWIYMANFRIAEHGADIFGVLDHFWSLAVEEHYYIFWPTIVFFLDRRALMIVTCIAAAVALLLRINLLQHGHDFAAYMITPARMDSLAAGSFVALAIRGPKGIAPLVKPAIVIGAVALLSFLSIVAMRKSVSPNDMVIGTIGLSLLWATFASMLVISLTWRPAVGVMSTGFLRWFGKYSYGMYVWHPIVIIILMHTAWGRSHRTGHMWLDLLGSVGLSAAILLLVTMLSWHLWEKQFLKLKKHFD